MSCHPEPNSHIRNSSIRLVKVVLDWTNYATKKELKDATGFHTCNVAAKRDFIALKADVDKLNINKLVNAPTDLNNLKT